MSHHHIHPHTASDNIKLAFILNLTFAVLEIFGGLWTHSVAILSDALHDFGDTLSLGLAWFLENVSAKKKDTKYSYGYRRFSLLGAFINIIILLGGSLFILSEAIPRLLRPEPANASGMMLFAVGGILVNGFAVFRLKRSQSMNARVVSLHLLEDALGWTAVLLVSVAVQFTDLYILDPILCMIITGYIVFNVIKNLKKTASLFLQATPDHVQVDEIEAKLLAIDGVQSVHHTHAWSLDGEHHVLTTHIVVDPGTTQEALLEIKNRVKWLAKPMDFAHITVETEIEGEPCSMNE